MVDVSLISEFGKDFSQIRELIAILSRDGVAVLSEKSGFSIWAANYGFGYVKNIDHQLPDSCQVMGMKKFKGFFKFYFGMADGGIYTILIDRGLSFVIGTTLIKVFEEQVSQLLVCTPREILVALSKRGNLAIVNLATETVLGTTSTMVSGEDAFGFNSSQNLIYLERSMSSLDTYVVEDSSTMSFKKGGAIMLESSTVTAMTMFEPANRLVVGFKEGNVEIYDDGKYNQLSTIYVHKESIVFIQQASKSNLICLSKDGDLSITNITEYENFVATCLNFERNENYSGFCGFSSLTKRRVSIKSFSCCICGGSVSMSFSDRTFGLNLSSSSVNEKPIKICKSCSSKMNKDEPPLRFYNLGITVTKATFNPWTLKLFAVGENSAIRQFDLSRVISRSLEYI